MDQQQLTFAMLGFNVLLALVAFFGGLTVREILTSIKDLRTSHEDLSTKHQESEQRQMERLGGYVKTDEFREYRTEQREYQKEQREMFKQMFTKLDGMSDAISRKADRGEARQ